MRTNPFERAIASLSFQSVQKGSDRGESKAGNGHHCRSQYMIIASHPACPVNGRDVNYFSQKNQSDLVQKEWLINRRAAFHTPFAQLRSIRMKPPSIVPRRSESVPMKSVSFY
jgi:hypothetical protein